MNSNTFVPARRTQFPVGVTIPALILLYGIGVPVTKLLEAFGKWPALLRKAPIARHPDFGTYRPNTHDVVACSAFKSGTNLLLQMAVQIAGKGRAEFDHIHDLVAWPDGPEKFPGYAIPLADETPWRTSPTGLRVIKTHHSVSKVPITDEARYVAVVRDPKSVCVSGYYFTKALMLGPMMPTVKHWAEDYMTPGYPLGDWAEHLAGYWALRSRANMLFMTYEDMITDLGVTARRLADFMGVELSHDELDEVVRLSGFAHMKSIARKVDFVKAAPWTKQEGATIRRGQKGSSSELLSPALQKRIDDHFRAELKRLDCDFPYDEVFSPRA
jgi:Sulfotransferase domain